MFVCVWNKTSNALWVGPLYKFPGVDFVCMHTAFIIFIYLHLSSSSSSVSCAGVWFYAHMCRNMRPRLSCDFPSVPAESAHHIWNMQVCFEHAEVRQLAYFQLNIEMCLPSYFPLSNVWIINVPENREQSKQLCEDLSHFLIFYFRLNVSWTLFEQRPEKTTHTPASGSDSCWSIIPKTKRVKLNMSARSSWFLYCWLELELKKNTRTVLPQQPAFISWSDVSWHKADMMKM